VSDEPKPTVPAGVDPTFSPLINRVAEIRQQMQKLYITDTSYARLQAELFSVTAEILAHVGHQQGRAADLTKRLAVVQEGAAGALADAAKAQDEAALVQRDAAEQQRKTAKWTKWMAIATLGMAVATVVMATASFLQTRQAARSAKAMEDANQISVAVAQAAGAPRFALRLDTIDDISGLGDSLSCRLRLKPENEDTRPIRVIALYCRVDSSQAAIAGMLFSVMGTDSLVKAGASADFPNSIRLRLPKTTDSLLITWLHVCAALRSEGAAGTSYVERVYLLGTKIPEGVIYSRAYWNEFTGGVYGHSIRLDPWCREKPFWPWRRAGVWSKAKQDSGERSRQR
jgi:hypothetical protein